MIARLYDQAVKHLGDIQFDRFDPFFLAPVRSKVQALVLGIWPQAPTPHLNIGSPEGQLDRFQTCLAKKSENSKFQKFKIQKI